MGKPRRVDLLHLQAFGARVSVYAKAIRSDTMEIRLLKINRAVERILVDAKSYWAARKSKDKIYRTDVLVIHDDASWERLLPYFVFEVEKHGGKHRIEYTLKDETENG
jgi:Holliday junction resolvase-like predicted endonuclease